LQRHPSASACLVNSDIHNLISKCAHVCKPSSGKHAVMVL